MKMKIPFFCASFEISGGFGAVHFCAIQFEKKEKKGREERKEEGRNGRRRKGTGGGKK